MSIKQTSSGKINKVIATVMKYIFELLVVAFGVFLGIYVGEQKSQRKTDANVVNTLSQILAEFDLNAKRLEKAYTYHEKVAVELDSATELLNESDYETRYYNNDKFKFQKLPSWKGLQTASLSNSVYESAKLSGVFQELNISTINLISSVYEHQKIYADYTKTTTDKFLNYGSNVKILDIISSLELLTKYDIMRMEKYVHKEISTAKKKLAVVVKDKKFKK